MAVRLGSLNWTGASASNLKTNRGPCFTKCEQSSS